MKTSTVALVAMTFCIGVLAGGHAEQGKREALQTEYNQYIDDSTYVITNLTEMALAK